MLTTQPLAATSISNPQGPTAIRNVYNWRVKETERMVAIVTELTKLGAKVGTGEGGGTWYG